MQIIDIDESKGICISGTNNHNIENKSINKVYSQSKKNQIHIHRHRH